jgi:hypothetical protein
MLNTKYVIFNHDQPAHHNKNALGNAWFVKKIKWVNNPDEEFEYMTSVDPLNEAAVNIEFKDHGLVNLGFDQSGIIKLVNYKPHQLTYESKTNAEMLAVFSEIYYPKGWHVYIDGELVDYMRANYLFRALVIPAGTHKIEFKFEPQSYLLGNLINGISSYLLLISLIIYFGVWIFKFTLKSRIPIEGKNVTNK